jgi:hypothetical protein
VGAPALLHEVRTLNGTKFLTAVQSLLNHDRTAITMIVGAVTLSLYDQFNAGRFSWHDTIAAGFAVIAGIARSALAPKVGIGAPDSVGK